MKNSRMIALIAAIVATPLAVQGAMRVSEAADESHRRREAQIQQLVDDAATRHEQLLETAEATLELAIEAKIRFEDEQKVAKNWQTVDGQE